VQDSQLVPKGTSTRESDRVADQLTRLILDGTLPSGVLIGEVQLSEALGCGRTPLREAVQRLAQAAPTHDCPSTRMASAYPVAF